MYINVYICVSLTAGAFSSAAEPSRAGAQRRPPLESDGA